MQPKGVLLYYSKNKCFYSFELTLNLTAISLVIWKQKSRHKM